MSSMLYKELTEKFKKLSKESLRKFFGQGGSKDSPQTPEIFNEKLKAMLENIADEVNLDDEQKRALLGPSNPANKFRWKTQYSGIKGSYSKLHGAFQALLDDEKAINRIEKKAYRRALFYRFLTTLAIGFAIMVVYWTAGCLGIHMPLTRQLIT